MGLTLDILQINTLLAYYPGLLDTESPEAGASEERGFHLGRKSPGPQCQKASHGNEKPGSDGLRDP